MKADSIKWIKKYIYILTSCSFITSRADTDAVAYSAHRSSLSKWELYQTWHLRDCMQYPQLHTKFQALKIGKHIYKSFSKQKSEIYLNILEEDADNSTELMLEECTSSSHDNN